MIVLGIETTCDETSCAIVKDGKEILSNVVASQIDLHSQYGGVVPELSCRRHIDVLIPILQQALQEAAVTLEDINLIAVAHGPGLIGALLIGLTAAKSFSLALDIPFVGINHIEAHLYAALMTQEASFPALGVVLSGGHTTLIKMDCLGSYRLIGETCDDAIGEAFDKVAKMLQLPYPGGPQIECLAKEGNPNRFAFKPGRVKENPYAFSFSGLKTSVLYTLNGEKAGATPLSLTQDNVRDIAASFQRAALTDVVDKTLKAAKEHQVHSIIFGGGVTNNQTLRTLFAEKEGNWKLLWPSAGLSLDNAAMIAGLGYHIYQRNGDGDALTLEAATRIAFI